MLTVTLYSKQNCHLCEDVKADLAALREQFPHKLVEVDITSDPALLKKYKEEIPVIEVGPYIAKAPLPRQKLQMYLGAAIDRKNQLEKIHGTEASLSKPINAGDKISYWISRNYLLILNVFMLLYVGLPFLAPTLMKAGLETPARALYTIYKPLCHQFGFRSFFLFGEQAFYPLEEAGIQGVKTFEEVTQIPNLNDPYSPTRFQAREFIGDETIGYKIALCERDVAIYAAILAFGIIFSITGRKLKSLHWMLWLLVGVAPVGLDGFSQLFSQFNWEWLNALLPYRESTPYLRVLTGGLFGFMTAWFAYPNIEDSMRETREYYTKKFAKQAA